jgi:ribose transport system ATP-binding protein
MKGAMTVPLVQMSGISKRFPGVVALDRVDLDVYPGEIVALAGENGAGKSTLMNILGGIHLPDSGTIRIDDAETAIHSVSDAIRKGIGFIHQELNILDNLDVAENVFLGREPVWAGPLKLVDRKQMHSQACDYLARLGLTISSRTPACELSIAQQQMVEIAKAISLDARLMIMDEPTSCLTLTETARLFDVINDLKTQGVSVIYITHRLREITDLADRIVVLRDGRNAGTLSGDQINHDRIVTLMVGRDLTRFYDHKPREVDRDYFRVLDIQTGRYPGHKTTLSVGRGEIFGLAGLVGSGRSELALSIFGVDPAKSGTVLLGGKTVTIRSPRDAIANGIYLVSEDRRKTGLVLEMSIRENITLPSVSSYASGGLINLNAERRAARDSSKTMQIKAPSLETKAANLSGGNQQKVVLAKWLSLSPKVLIFDEPTRGIDVGAKSEIYQLMRELAQSGVAVIMISSDLEEILAESDRVAVMHEGCITGILERNECSEEAIMRLAVGQSFNC